MDHAEPPRIVFETSSACTDSAAALRRALGPARAPGSGWVVTMRVEGDGARGLRAQGAIDDGDGMSVARRTIDASSGDCGALGRAVGIWASLVLDAQTRKQEANALAQGSSGSTSTMPAHDTASPPATAPASPAPPSPDPSASVSSGWPPPAQPIPLTPEHDWYLHHDRTTRRLEAGAGVFLMTGTGGGALAGPSAFMFIEVDHGIFLRPSVGVGESLTSLPPADVTSSTWAAARLDACLRLPGLYTQSHGMQLDLCGGADGGVSQMKGASPSMLPYAAVGPSLDLRGELGGNFAAALRAVGGLNILRPSFEGTSGATDRPPIAGARIELALSWNMR